MKQYSCIFILSIALCSCKEELLLNESSKAPVINCFFNPDENMRVNLSETYNAIGDDTISYIYNANLALYNNDNNLLKQLIPEKVTEDGAGSKGYYYSDTLCIQAKKKYTLIYKQADGTIVKGSDEVPASVAIKEIKDTAVTFDNNKNKCRLVCTLTFNDPQDEINYYAVAVNIRAMNELFPYQQFTCNSPLIEAVISNNNLPCYQMIFSDKKMKASQNTIQLDINNYITGYSESVPITFEIMLFSISKNYYTYALSFYKQILANKDFYSEPSSVYSNIENGYGIFAGYSKSVKTVKVTIPAK